MKFNEFLKNLREKNGLTQQMVADSIGVNISTIQNWERADNKPDLNSIPNIASLYKVSTEDILKMLAVDLNIINKVDETNNDNIKYIDVLPKNINYSVLKGFKFTDKEQELFLTFVLNLRCGGNPVPEMSKIALNNLELALFFDKMEKYDICKHLKYNSECSSGVNFNYTELTDKGELVFKIIKQLNGELFNVNTLNLKTLLNVFEVYEIQKDALLKVKIIKELVSCEYFLEKYEKSIHYDYEEKKPIYTLNKYKNSRKLTREECLKLIDSSYYTIEKIECKDEDYIKEKELYFRKLDFYEKNKELAEGLIKPTKYKEKFTLLALPTDKAKKFVRYYMNEL